MSTDDEGILGRLRREAQAEDDRLPRYHEDRPGRLSNNGVHRRRWGCTNVHHDAVDCEAAGLPFDQWCGACMLAD